jgi:hypothetical protein
LVMGTAPWDIKISQYSSPWNPIRKLLNSMVENIRLLQTPLGGFARFLIRKMPKFLMLSGTPAPVFLAVVDWIRHQKPAPGKII